MENDKSKLTAHARHKRKKFFLSDNKYVGEDIYINSRSIVLHPSFT